MRFSLWGPYKNQKKSMMQQDVNNHIELKSTNFNVKKETRKLSSIITHIELTIPI